MTGPTYVELTRDVDDIEANGNKCLGPSSETATVDSTDTVRVTGASGGQQLAIRVSGGPFAPGFTEENGGSDEIEFAVNLRGGSDLMLLYDSSSADRFRFGVKNSVRRINLNAGEGDGVDADVRAKNTEEFVVAGSQGNDFMSGAGGKGTGSEPTYRLNMSDGDGDDKLVGGSASDTLIDNEGTGYSDVLKGSGRDGLNAQDGDTLDSLNGGDGTDNCHADDGDVVTGCEPV
jgi:hypothetical protein